MTLLTLALACGTGSQTVRSEPAEPTVDIGGHTPQSEITWATLDGFLPTGEPAIPPDLVGLSLGQPESDARAALEALANDKLIRPEEQTLEGITVTSARLKGKEHIGVTLMLKGGVLDELDVSLPDGEGLFAANEAWGKADEQLKGLGSIPRPSWVHDGLRVTVITTTDGPTIFKYSRVE